MLLWQLWEMKLGVPAEEQSDAASENSSLGTGQKPRLEQKGSDLNTDRFRK